MKEITSVAIPGRWLHRILLTVTICVGVAEVRAEEPPSKLSSVDYQKQIKPLFRSHCYACHGALKQEGGLRLDTADLAKRGGDSGPALIPAQAAQSYLLERISSDDPGKRMPPPDAGEPFSPADIALVRQWIQEGAKAPLAELPEKDPRDHWAFRPIRRPAVPDVPEFHDWMINPIDAFVARAYRDGGLKPVPSASRSLLLRRLSLDLIGLPPEWNEIQQANQDVSRQWYRRTVERLLDDPRHGERWARHWMDIWRYSDWWGLGQQLRYSQKHIWHWRDWIIESLNEDLPYDEMVRLMLAADELHPEDLGRLRATGYLARNYFLFNRSQWMHETVEHVGKGLLGLTMNCARCHDHKYDPVAQDDYYRLRAFFEPYHARLDLVPGETDMARDAIPRVFDARLDEPTYVYIRGDEKKPDESRIIPPGVPEILDFEDLVIEPLDLPASSWQPQRRSWVIDDQIAAKAVAVEAAMEARDEAAAALRDLEKAESAKGKPEPPGDDRIAGEEALVAEDFSALSEELWELFGDGWKHAPGQLEQLTDGPSRSVLRYRGQPPRDFDATLVFTLRGGSRWRSIGVSFDAAPTDPTRDAVSEYHEKNVYVSGFAGGPKIHSAYNEAGKWTYPPAPSVQSLPIAMNRRYTLRIQVRDRVVNASLDGTPVLACQTALNRREGRLQITNFDALTVFHEFRLTQLDPRVKLRAPGSLSPAETIPERSVEALQTQLRIADARLASARAELNSVQQRGRAWRARWSNQPADAQENARLNAVRAQRELAVVQNMLRLINAEIERDKAAPDKRDAAEKSLMTARGNYEKSMLARDAEIGTSELPEEFVGAHWTPTRFLSSSTDDPVPEFAPQSSGRRSALARWITDRRNPLTARVAVNHVWMRHMGEPLVSTVFDFGRNGAEPSHPELLDWLASELIDSGWSMRHLHRLIVESASYRLAAEDSRLAANRQRDPENRKLWRRSVGRMESQVVRDSLYLLAGRLDSAMGGPSVPSAAQSESSRRSLYFYHSNNERNLFLTMFDEALVTDCYRRDQSVIPQQALAMSNSRMVMDLAGPIADRLQVELGEISDERFVEAVFLLLIAEIPEDAERNLCVESLAAWRSLKEAGTGKDANRYARTQLVWVLLNHNDYITIR